MFPMPEVSPGRPPRRSGFTIVEAVVLISIIGLLASIAAPRFLAMSDFQAFQSQRQVLNDLRFAQRLAMHSGCPVQVDFTTGGYVLSQRNACRTGGFGLALTDPASNRIPFSIVLPTGILITSSLDPLVFDSLGRTTTTTGAVSDATLTVGGLTLEAVGETGLVRVP